MRKGVTERDTRPTFRELEALQALIELRKTTSAAHQLGVSQPAISRAIHDLEQRLGRSLFRRQGGRLVATEDGVQLYHDSRAILQALDRLGRPEAEAATGALLKLIAPPTLAHHFLPPLLARYSLAETGVRLQVEIGTTGDVTAKVADGIFDIGIADSPGPHPSLTFDPFRRSFGHVAMRDDHPLAAKAEIAPGDLEGAPLIALTRRFPSRGALERLLADAGVKPSIRVEVATSTLAFALVREGLGLTLINPFPIASFADLDGLALRPFAPRVGYETAFVRSAALPPSASQRAFMDFIRREQAPDPYSEIIRGHS